MLNLRGVYLSSGSSHGSSNVHSSFDAAGTVSGIEFASSVVGNLGAPLHAPLGSPTFSASESPTETAADGADSRTRPYTWDEGADWEMEDESLETSRDPLVAGLFREDDSLEMAERVPVGATLPLRIDV